MAGITVVNDKIDTVEAVGTGASNGVGTLPLITGWAAGANYLEIPVPDAKFIADAVQYTSPAVFTNYTTVGIIHHVDLNLAANVSASGEEWKVALILCPTSEVPGIAPYNVFSYFEDNGYVLFSKNYMQGAAVSFEVPAATVMIPQPRDYKLVLALFKISGGGAAGYAIRASVTYQDRTFKEIAS